MKIARSLVAATVGLSSMLLASSAFAQEGADGEVTAKPVSAAVFLGVGSGGLGFGLGARVGYTLPMKLYLGASFTYHFVSSTSYGNLSPSNSFFYPGVEGGYELKAGPVWIRPYLGLGVGISSYSGVSGNIGGVNVNYPGSSSTDFAAWPGCVVTYNINQQFFVAGDARILLVSGYSSFNAFVSGGMRF